MTSQVHAHPVSDWVWRDDGLQRDSDLQCIDDTAALGGLEGHFALHLCLEDGSHLLARDALGVNKLFYAIDAEGGIASSNYLKDLRVRGFPINAIHSVPSGHYVRIQPTRREYKLEEFSSFDFNDGNPTAEHELGRHAGQIREALDATFRRLARALRGRRIVVTLSGGLDSSVIAVLARKWLTDVSAVTFCLGQLDEQDKEGDLASATRVAEKLDLPLRVVSLTPDKLLSLLDPVLIYGQDWRDFNVHSGLVSAAIGEALGVCEGGAEGRQRTVILTGDTMNELMADYAAETYAGEEYYSLPDMSRQKLRRFLVAGLDTGDREVGIFAHYGIDTIQPYALCADAYTAVPGGWLESGQAKQALVREVMGDEVPSHVYARPKVRAQVASAAGVSGTLAALVDRGYDSVRVAERFCQLLDIDASALRNLMRAGVYRFPVDYPSDAQD